MNIYINLAILTVIILHFNSSYAANISSTPILKIPPKQSIYDVSYNFEIKALKLALTETESVFGKVKIEETKVYINRHNLLQLLDVNTAMDLVTAEPSRDSEVNYSSINIPLFKGLMGYRMFLILPRKKKLFESIKTPKQLKSLKACQVGYWLDGDILESNGYKVVRVEDYNDMFNYLNAEKCDYIPRSIISGYGEEKSYNSKHPNHPVTTFNKFLFHSYSPKITYTSHKHFELATRLQLGLERASNDGKLLKLLKSDPVTKLAFPLRKWHKSHIIELNNPYFVRSIPIYDKNLWLTLPSKH